MRGGTLLILGHGVKGQGQLWHFVYKTLWTRYRLQFLPNHFQTSHVSCGSWEEEPYWFWVTGSKVKVNFGTLCIRPCGHNSDFSFCPIAFKLHMHIHHDERRNPIDFGSRVHISRSTLPPARGCHALRCLVYFSSIRGSTDIRGIGLMQYCFTCRPIPFGISNKCDHQELLGCLISYKLA